MLEVLKTSLEEAPIVKKGEYDYFIHPITDGVPEIEPRLLREIVEEIKNRLIRPYDKLVAIEAMGLPVGVALALDMDKPLVIIRKKSYALNGEVAVQQVTGYSKSRLFINGLKANDRVAIIDDVVSTGGTLKAVLDALNELDVNIVDVVTVIEKGEGRRFVEEQTGIQLNTLVKVDVIGGKVVVLDR